MAKNMKDIIVIKIGSSVLMTEQNKLDEVWIAHIAKQIKTLQKEGTGVVLVISGAVAYGANFVDLSTQRSQLRQAAAGIGQVYLTSTFNCIFSENNLQLAQILLTKDSLRKESQRAKVQDLIEFYTHSGFIAFINENDVLDLNSFGGNDLLATEVTSLLQAKKLLILSTMKGATYAVGGGKTKVEAIQILSQKHIQADILNGKTNNILLQALL